MDLIRKEAKKNMTRSAGEDPDPVASFDCSQGMAIFTRKRQDLMWKNHEDERGLRRIAQLFSQDH
jgi:hypothetical protein